MKTAKILLAATIGTFAVGFGTVHALDTDVYLKSQSLTARDDAPNVMIILDNSGSMDTVVFSPPKYDPLVDYCNDDLNALYPGMPDPNSTKPSNCAEIKDRIYFSFSGVPDTTSNSWFDASKNKCISSHSALDNNNKNDAGFYSGTKIARWRSGSNWNSLSGQENNDITYVDCQADGTKNGLVANDNNRPRSSSSTAYTTSSSSNFNWNTFSSNTSPTLYSANYINYRNNPSLLANITRMDIAKGAVTGFINGNSAVRFGLAVFNINNTSPQGGRIVYKIDNMTDERREEMTDIVNNLIPSTNTPLAETLYEVYRYFSGSSVQYGDENETFCIRSMTRTGSTVRVRTGNSSCSSNKNHGYSDGDMVTIFGATQPEYNGWHVIDVIDGDEFEFTVSGTPATPATGSPKVTLIRDISAENNGNYISPFQYACQKAYVIYVTDGDPTEDSNANSAIESRIGKTCDNIPNGSGGRTSTKNCLDDLAGWMYNNDVYNGQAGVQSVSTFTVGFGTGISAAGRALLQETATEGGGQYYTAQNSSELVDALQNALASILEETTSFTAPSLSINAFNRQFNRDEVYLSVFRPSNSCAWDGNLKKYRLCKQSDINLGRCTSLGQVLDANNALITDQFNNIVDTARSFWSSSADGSTVDAGGAGANVPAATSRNIYTYVGNYSSISPSTTGVKVEISGTNSFYTTVTANPTLLGLPSTASTTDVNNLINWILGRDVYDHDADGNTTEMRWRFGDPLHSRSVPITYGGTETSPIVKLFVGSNDGMVRMINNDTGVEEWAFLPKEMFGMQYALSQDAGSDHLYGMDNTPSFWIRDINRDGIINPSVGDRVYMYMTQRRGGRNVYAFDVTPPSTLTTSNATFTPKLMWVIEGGTGNFAKLGQTWSIPSIVRVRFNCNPASICNDGNPNTDDSSSRVVLMFGGGYDTNQDNNIPAGTDSVGNAIYMVDPLTGERIWWASSDSSATLVLSRMKYSIPSDLMPVDTNGDGTADRIYVGDMGGQLWRIDLGTSLGVNQNGGTTAYVFADIGCTGGSRTNDCAATTAQNRRKFFYPPDVGPVVDNAYSVNPTYDLITIGTGDREDPLDILTSNLTTPASREAVHNRLYAFRDYNYTTGAPASTPAPITDADLFDATTSGAETTTQINALRTSKGWYMDLRSPSAVLVPNGLTTAWIGEKVLARTTLFDGKLYATTFTPANDTNSSTTCDANAGVATEYVLDALTAVGAGDFDGDGIANERSSVVGGGIPSEVVIIFRPDGATGLINAGGKGGAPVEAEGSFDNRAKPIYWYEE